MIRSRFSVFFIAAVSALAAMAASAADRIDMVRPSRASFFDYALPVLVFATASLVFTATQIIRVLRSYRIGWARADIVGWPAPQTGVPELTSFA